MLSWYDEDPAWLAECVAGATILCDFIIAIDGAYADFPGAVERPFSPQRQHETIVRTAQRYGIGAATHRKATPWASEVAKRNFMLQDAKDHANEGDWLFRIDADEVLTRVGYDTREVLEYTPHDVSEVILWDAKWGGGTPLRALYRNVPNLRIDQAHYRVLAHEGTVLNGENAVPAQQLWDVRLEHRTHERTPDRLIRKAIYNNLIPELEKVECP